MQYLEKEFSRLEEIVFAFSLELKFHHWVRAYWERGQRGSASILSEFTTMSNVLYAWYKTHSTGGWCSWSNSASGGFTRRKIFVYTASTLWIAKCHQGDPVFQLVSPYTHIGLSGHLRAFTMKRTTSVFRIQIRLQWTMCHKAARNESCFRTEFIPQWTLLRACWVVFGNPLLIRLFSCSSLKRCSSYTRRIASSRRQTSWIPTPADYAARIMRYCISISMHTFFTMWTKWFYNGQPKKRAFATMCTSSCI